MVSRKLQLHFLLLLLAGSLILVFFIFKPFLTPLALATVFAVVLQPLYRRIGRHTGGAGSLSALFTVLITVVCILIPLSFLGTRIFYESLNVYDSLTMSDSGSNPVISLTRNVGQTLERTIPGAASFFDNLSVDFDMYAKQGLEWLIAHVGTALSGITTLFLSLFIFFVTLYYLLRDGRTLKHALVILSPLDDRDDEMVFGRLALAINSVIKGSLTIALVQGVLTAIGLTIFGVPNSVLFGTIAAIAALIPAVGTSLVLVPATLYLFVTGHTGPAIGLLGWGVLAVGLIDNFLGPKLVSRGMELHPLFILLSVLGGIVFFGPIGIFLGPLSISLLFAFITIYSYLADPGRPVG